MMDKKLLGTMALVTIVVAVVVSVLTASITGNYTWVSKVDRLSGTNRVYTVNEIDKMFYTRSEVDAFFTHLLEDIISDEIAEPLFELRLIEHCDQFIQLGEINRSVNLGGEGYDFALLNISSSDEATIKIGNVVKSVTKGQTYEFGGVSGGSLPGMKSGVLKVYVKGIEYTPGEDNAKVVMLEASNCVL